MGFKSDIEIAQEAKPQDIREIAKKLGLGEDDIELYGKYKAKVDYNLLKRGNGGKKAIKQELKQIKQDLKNQQRITLSEIQDLEARIQLSERYYGFSGVLAIYAGILSLNNDLTVHNYFIKMINGEI